MNRLTPFELMRRNRPKVAKARELVSQRIDRIEQEMTGHWSEEIDELQERAAEEMARERIEWRKARPPRRPSFIRRWWNFGFGFGENA